MRVELERYIARTLQKKEGSFTISRVLTLMVENYTKADGKREEISIEMKRWVEDDSFVRVVSCENGVNKYYLI